MTALEPAWTLHELEETAAAVGIDLQASDGVARAVRRLHSDLVDRNGDEAAEVLDRWTEALEERLAVSAAAVTR